MCSQNYGSMKPVPQTTMLEGTALSATAYLDPSSPTMPLRLSAQQTPIFLSRTQIKRLLLCKSFTTSALAWESVSSSPVKSLQCLIVLDCSIYLLLSDLADA